MGPSHGIHERKTDLGVEGVKTMPKCPWVMLLAIYAGLQATGANVAFAQLRGGGRFMYGRGNLPNAEMEWNSSYSMGQPQFGWEDPRCPWGSAHFGQSIRADSGWRYRVDNWRSYGGAYTRPRGSGPYDGRRDPEDAYGYLGRGYGRNRYAR